MGVPPAVSPGQGLSACCRPVLTRRRPATAGAFLWYLSSVSCSAAEAKEQAKPASLKTEHGSMWECLLLYPLDRACPPAANLSSQEDGLPLQASACGSALLLAWWLDRLRASSCPHLAEPQAGQHNDLDSFSVTEQFVHLHASASKNPGR